MTTLDCAIGHQTPPSSHLYAQTVPKFAAGSNPSSCRNLPTSLTPGAAQKYQQLLLPAVGRAYKHVLHSEMALEVHFAIHNEVLHPITKIIARKSTTAQYQDNVTKMVWSTRPQ